MLKASINDTSYSVDFRQEGILVNDELWTWDLVSFGENLFHLVKGSRSYVIELQTTGEDNKHLQVKVNGVAFEVKIQDRYDLLLEKLGMNRGGETNHGEVRAPMPGRILEVLVNEGQIVSKGDKLFILEAMKMENVIRSIGHGTIKSVNIQKGMKVEKNQVLIQF